MEAYPQIDEYGLQHLSYHLFRTGNARKLFQVVSSKTWFSASANFDLSRQQYNQDIDYAFRSLSCTIHTSLKNNIFDDLPEQIAQVTSLAWLASRLGQSASRITSKTLEALTFLGSGQEAVRRARTIPDPVRRAEALAWIGFASYYIGNQSLKEEAWSEAESSFRNSPRGFFNDFIETKAKYALILNFAGEKHKSAYVANELANDFHEIETTAIGITSTAQAAMAAVWAEVGGFIISAEQIPKIFSLEDQMQALRDIVEISLSTGANDVSPYVQMALDRSPKLTDPKSFQLLGEILGRTGAFDQVENILQRNDISRVNRAWICSAGAAYAKSINNPLDLQKWATQAISETDQISESNTRLRLCASLIVDKHLFQPFVQWNELLIRIQKDIDLLKDQLDEDTLGLCALALCVLGNKDLAQDLTAQAASVTILPDDWDETYGLILVAKRLGDLQDSQRLQQVLDITNYRTDLWQRAEIICAIALSQNEEGAVALKAQAALEEILHDEPGLAQRPNALGALAVWKFLSSGDIHNPEGNALVDQSVALLESNEDQASALSFLALTLSQYQLTEKALEVIELSIQSLKIEDDPNTVARVISEILQVLMTLDSGYFPQELWEIAESISDEGLQVEAYFWLAGFLVVQGKLGEAQETFHRAFQLAGWSEIDLDEIEQALVSVEKVDQFLLAVDSIEWPSTKVALLFTGLAMMLADPKPWHVHFGLEAIDHLDEAYTEKRALILNMMATGMEKLGYSVSEYIDVYMLALSHSKARIVGEPWAVFRSFYPFIQSKGFPELAEFVWDDWMKINRFFS